MVSLLKKLLKITFLVSIFGLLFFSFNLFYNQGKESIAQEPTLSCEEDEIPLGAALDEAFDLASAINNNIQTVFSSSQSQITSAKSLFDLPEQCKAEKCSTDCTTDSQTVTRADYSCPLKEVTKSGFSCPSGETCTACVIDRVGGVDVWGWCWEETTGDQCEISDCYGIPCPAGQADSLFNAISSSYAQIANSSSAISDSIPKRDDIIKKLDEARKGLAKCVTPAGEKTEAEAEVVKDLLTCQEAQYQRALPSGKTGCDNPNNFLCCYYK